MAKVIDNGKREGVRKKTRQGAGKGTKKSAIKPYRGQGGQKRSKR
tara:strand:- start:302 stop:436 length:135 start_codon:yes stop_codon:yes gene_type:complete